jgi:hypothetical protein
MEFRFDSRDEGSVRAANSLRTDGRNFAGDSSTDGCWRENRAGNHEGKRHAAKNKNKAVFGTLTIGLCFWRFVDVSLMR